MNTKKTWWELRIEEAELLGRNWMYEDKHAYLGRAEWFVSERFANWFFWDEGNYDPDGGFDWEDHSGDNECKYCK